MAEKNITKNALINMDLPESIDNAVKNISDKPTQEIGGLLGDCIFLVFGGISQRAELKRAKYAHELQQFKKELNNKISVISTDKLIEPDVQVVCTALDNMKYCVEIPELRNMFSTLLANSLNEDTYNIAHPAYGEIIRQLTAFDANVLIWLKEQEEIPTIRLRIQNKEKNEYVQIPNIYLVNDFGNHDKLQVALDNLSRLKIIDLNLETSFADKTLYNIIRENAEYKNDINTLKEQIGDEQEIKDSFGEITITQFGQQFIEACC